MWCQAAPPTYGPSKSSSMSGKGTVSRDLWVMKWSTSLPSLNYPYQVAVNKRDNLTRSGLTVVGKYGAINRLKPVKGTPLCEYSRGSLCKLHNWPF